MSDNPKCHICGKPYDPDGFTYANSPEVFAFEHIHTSSKVNIPGSIDLDEAQIRRVSSYWLVSSIVSENPEYYSSEHIRLLLKKWSDGLFDIFDGDTPEILQARIDAYDRAWICSYCGHRALGHLRHVDHIIPQRVHGPDEAWNYANSCQRCNCQKSDKFLLPASIAGKFWNGARSWYSAHRNSPDYKVLFWREQLLAHVPENLRSLFG